MSIVMETTNIVHEGNSKSLNYFAHLCIKTKILSKCKHCKIDSSFILVTQKKQTKKKKQKKKKEKEKKNKTNKKTTK
jgi:hypothetical protein